MFDYFRNVDPPSSHYTKDHLVFGQCLLQVSGSLIVFPLYVLKPVLVQFQLFFDARQLRGKLTESENRITERVQLWGGEITVF